jgi:RND family efflux transporter MFP subunit
MKPITKKNATIFSVVAVLLIVVWFAMAHRPRKENPSEADMNGTPTVAVAKVMREDLFKAVTIPAEFRPYEEVELHAKVSGYLNKINVDFGDKVKAGQLLAIIEVPELRDQLNNALAAEQKSEVDYTNAHLIYTRLVAVNQQHPNLVAEQDLDTAEANDQAGAAAIAAAQAEAGRLKTMVGYTQITAPFDGVVTRRYADPGALIQAGTSSDTQSRPLVRVSDNYLLRLDFPVDVDFVKDIHAGDPVDVHVESLGKTFSGTVSRFTDDVDDNTRKMTTEIEVPNPSLEIDPGMYATVSLKVENHTNVLAIPTEAVSGGDKPEVFAVNRDNQIEVRPVQLGLQTSDRYEVLSGLQEGDLVVVGNRSEIQNGQKVEPKQTGLSMRVGN